METDEIKKRLAGLTGGEKVLVAIAVVFLLAVVAFFGWTSVGSSTIPRTNSLTQHYQWSGDQLVLYTDSKTTSRSCSVTPQQGEARSVAVPAQSRKRFSSTRYTTVRPWFAGTAAVTCNGNVTAYHGAGAARWMVQSTLWFKAVCVVLIVAPLAVIVVRRGARRRQPGAAPDPAPENS